MMINRGVLIFLLFTLTASLTGCLSSEKPLFDIDQSVQPFQNLKVKDKYGVIGLGGTEHEYILVGKYYYNKKEYTTNKSKATRYALYALSKDVYLIQTRPESWQPQAHDFAIVKRLESKFLVFQSCSEIASEFLKKYKVQVDEDLFGGDLLCTFNSLESVAALSNLPGIWENSSEIEILSIK